MMVICKRYLRQAGDFKVNFMKKYEKAQLAVIIFDASSDVITYSVGVGNDNDFNDTDWD